MKRYLSQTNPEYRIIQDPRVEAWDELLGSSADVVARYDLVAGKIIYVNERIKHFTGFSREEFIGYPFTHMREKIGLIGAWAEGFDKAAICRKAHTLLSEYESETHGKFWFETIISPEFDSAGALAYVTAVCRDITRSLPERRRKERYSSHWDLMIELSRKFITALPDNVDKEINHALASIGNLLEGDRAYLFEYDFVNGTVSNSHEWCKEGITPQMENLQQYPIALVPEWIEKHILGEPLVINEVKSLHTKSAIRQMLDKQGIKSLQCVPLMPDDRCIGSVGIDYVTKQRSIPKEEVELLQLFASLVANLEEKLHAEKERRRTDTIFKVMVERAFAGIYILRDGQFEFANGLFCRLTGYSFDELAHPMFSLEKLITFADDHAQQSIAERRAGDLSPKSYKVEICTKSGVMRSITVNTTGIKDERGVYTLGIAFDMAKGSEDQQAIEDINKVLKVHNAELKEFAQLASHNLRAPIANISGLLGHLDRTQIGGKLNQIIIDGLHECIESINETLNDMLLVLQSDQEDKVFRKEISLGETYAKVAVMLADQILESGAHIECQFLHDRFVYNSSHIENFMLNMLTNAIRYRSDHRPLVVKIHSAINADGQVVLTFSDNGCGIDLEKFGAKMFKMYERFNHHPDSRGLGLYLVKSQLEKYGGSIDVESKPDEGASFTLKLNPLP